jgi:hypothetical protein
MLQFVGKRFKADLFPFVATFPLKQKSYDPLLLLKTIVWYLFATSIIFSEFLNLNSSLEFPNADKKKKLLESTGNLSFPVGLPFINFFRLNGNVGFVL